MPSLSAGPAALWSSLDDQTARLDRSNGRGDDVIAKADSCQAHQAKVMATLTAKPWWRFW